MPKKVGSFDVEDFGEDDVTASDPKQAQFPKSQGGGGARIAPKEAPNIPGTNVKDYGEIDTAKPVVSTPEDSLGDGTWSSWLHDATHPQSANLNRPQTWRDWFTKTYHPTVKNVADSAVDDISFGGADYLQSKLTGENVGDIRARTADSQAAMGPAGPLLNAATYAIPGAGEGKILGKVALAAPGKVLGVLAKKAAPTVGRYGAAAGEGAAANTLSTVGHEVGSDEGGNFTGINPWDVGKAALVGTGVGVGGQAAADVLTPALRWTGDKWANRPGRSGETPTWANWRQQAKTDPAAVQDKIQKVIDVDPTSPRVAPLQDLHSALNQSTEPGIVAHATSSGIGYGLSSTLGADPLMQTAITAAAPWASKTFVNPPARAINTIDRDINVGKAFDRNFAPATNRPAVTGDSSRWADWIRQGLIGANSQAPF